MLCKERSIFFQSPISGRLYAECPGYGEYGPKSVVMLGTIVFMRFMEWRFLVSVPHFHFFVVTKHNVNDLMLQWNQTHHHMPRFTKSHIAYYMR